MKVELIIKASCVIVFFFLTKNWIQILYCMFVKGTFLKHFWILLLITLERD